MKPKRPIAVTFISWFVIVIGASSLTSTLINITNPKVIEVMRENATSLIGQYTIIFAGLGVMIVSGLGMLGGKNWGRLIFIAWGTVGTFIVAWGSPWKAEMIPGLLLFMTMGYYLFKENANIYFNSKQLGTRIK